MTSISRMNVTTPKPRSNGTRCSRRTYKRRIPTAAQPTLSVPKGASDAPGKSPNDFDHCVLGCWGDSMRPRFRGRNALETPRDWTYPPVGSDFGSLQRAPPPAPYAVSAHQDRPHGG